MSIPLIKKSRFTAITLSVIFGPLGLLYVDVLKGLMFTIFCLLVLFVLFTVPLLGVIGAPSFTIAMYFAGILYADSATHKHNKEVELFAALLTGRNYPANPSPSEVRYERIEPTM